MTVVDSDCFTIGPVSEIGQMLGTPLICEIKEKLAFLFQHAQKGFRKKDHCQTKF